LKRSPIFIVKPERFARAPRILACLSEICVYAVIEGIAVEIGEYVVDFGAEATS
jgi:hypothetical protein